MGKFIEYFTFGKIYHKGLRWHFYNIPLAFAIMSLRGASVS